MRNKLDQVIRILKNRSYTIAEIPYGDEFGRFRVIAKNKKGQKLFIKSVVGKQSYAYSSLLNEAHLCRFLSQRINTAPVLYKRFKLKIPEVEEVIEENNCVIFISHFIKGKSLSDLSSKEQAEKIIAVYSLVNSLDIERDEIAAFRLKDFSKLNILLQTPLRCIRAFFLQPRYAIKLIFAALHVIPLAFAGRLRSGLVHSDINASNIILDKKDIYLVDWEEAGWGLILCNQVAPLCCHWIDNAMRRIIYTDLNRGNSDKITIPLIAFRTLILFNQKIKWGSKKHRRDVKLLNSL